MSFLKSKHSGWTWGMKRTPYMGGGSGGGSSGPTQTNVQNSNIPEYARPYTETMLGTAQQQVYNYDANGNVIGFKPYIPYGATVDSAGNITNTAQEQAEAAVAPFSPLQQTSFYNAGNLGLPGQYNTGTGYAALGGIGASNVADRAAMTGANYNMMATNPYATQAFMSPYVQNALQPQLTEMNRQYDITGLQEKKAATGAGAFGGTRNALMQAENQRNKNMAMNQAIGSGYQNAFQAAQQAQQYGANLGLQGLGTALQGTGQLTQAGTALANIGTQQLQGQQGIIGLQNQMGGQQQTQQQNLINQAMQNYAMQQQYPQQQLAFMSGLLRGLPLQSATTQSYQAAPSAISQLSGLGLTGAAAYGMMKKEGGVIKSYAEGGDVASTNSTINVPPPEGYKYDAQTGQYHEIPGYDAGNLGTFNASMGVLDKIKALSNRKDNQMAAGGSVDPDGADFNEPQGFASGGISQAISRKILLNPDAYSKQTIDRGTKSGLVDDIVGLAAIQQKNKDEKERLAQKAMMQPKPPTVKDQILAERAALDQQGIEAARSNLPTEYAGGGIIAFDDGGEVEHFDEGGFAQSLKDYYKRMTGTLEGATDKTTTSPGMPTIGGIPLFGAANKDAVLESRATDAPATDKPAAPVDNLTVIRDNKGPGTKPSTSLEQLTGAPTMKTDTGGIDEIIKQSIGDIKNLSKDNAEARKQAKLMGMLQAGLGIMGGTSPFAAVNFKGALPAAQGYQEEMRGIRADEAKQLGQIAALNLKGAELKQELKKLGITENLSNAQIKELLAKAGYYSQRGAGAGVGGGSIGSSTALQMRQDYKSALANPTSSPVFGSLDKQTQKFLTKADPSSASYQQAYQVFKNKLDNEFMGDVQFVRAVGNKRSDLSSLE